MKETILEIYKNNFNSLSVLEDFFAIKKIRLLYHNSRSSRIYVSLDTDVFRRVFNKEPQKGQQIEVPSALSEYVSKIFVKGFFEVTNTKENK